MIVDKNEDKDENTDNSHEAGSGESTPVKDFHSWSLARDQKESKRAIK